MTDLGTSSFSKGSESGHAHLEIQKLTTHSVGFDGEVFTLGVGCNKKKLSAHENALSRSPVLKALCSLHFKEGATKQIDLPDGDDDETFEQLLHYLYTGVLKRTAQSIESEMWSLVSPYIATDKYQILEPKHDIMTAMVAETGLVQSVSVLLWMKEVYNKVPDSDTEIKGVFNRIIHDLFELLTQEDMAEVERIMEAGGRFALEL